ncbi:MAG: hypothetical protein H7276_07570 [Caulobacter sp.]|nr:hypothetical protein [Vitreoscilla sp.]
MNNGRDQRAIGLVLAALFAATAAQAQEVHKCNVNGAVTYQSTPCPAADLLLPTAPTPSDQELRQARVDQSRQRWQAATGVLMRPTYVPPPPPPPSGDSTTTTTIVVLPSAGHNGMVIRQTTHGYTPPAKPLSNCEKLNRDSTDAIDRRDQLRAPSELASHAEMLQKAESEVLRLQQLAMASNCKLAH